MKSQIEEGVIRRRNLKIDQDSLEREENRSDKGQKSDFQKIRQN